MISIITTSYNYSKYISETIKSVLAQTYSDWELIIVDDASSDNSIDIIKDFQIQDKRIKLICHDKNKGLVTSIKTGLKYAKGEWIAFLESDDTFDKSALQERINICKSYTDINFIFNDVNEFGNEKSVLAIKNNLKKYRKILNQKKYPTNIFKDINTDNLLLTLSAVMIKRKEFENIDLNAPVDALFDWWLFIHITFKNKVFYINKKLTNWRQHKNSYLYKKRPHFKCTNIEAYLDIMKTQKLGLKFVPFLLKTILLMGLKRTKYYYVIFIRMIKKILGIKPKSSPLFDD